MEKHTETHVAALAKALNGFGLRHDHAAVLAAHVLRAIEAHGAEDVRPVEIKRTGASGMAEVDDVTGMEEALGHLATALINIEDALA